MAGAAGLPNLSLTVVVLSEHPFGFLHMVAPAEMGLAP